MRIAIGQLWQETNTFNPHSTRRSDFDAFGVYRGEELVERMENVNEPGGFIHALRQWPELPEIVGLVRLAAWPGGMLTSDTFDWIVEEMLCSLDRAGEVDAVLLALHGAMVASNEPDVEGAVLERIRQRIGKKPLVATLDLHANLTERMVKAADVLVTFHTTPHVDVYETGLCAASVLRRLLVDQAKPVTAYRKLPMVAPVERANTQDPTSVSYDLRQRLEAMERDPKILSAGLITVQPWLDVPDLGCAVLVVSDGDPERSNRLADELVEEVWRRRNEYRSELFSVQEAVEQAKSITDGLVVLSDCADATTSGSPGDSTHLLAALLVHDWPRPALVTMVSPSLVSELASLPPGTHWSGELGGRLDHLFSRPLRVKMEMVRSFDARFVLSGHIGKNLPIDMGRSVLLRQRNVYVVVTSRSGPHFAPELFCLAGMNPFEASVLVAKSPCGFRAAYADRAVRILVVRAPGCSPPDFWRYAYHRIPRLIWPWEESTDLDDGVNNLGSRENSTGERVDL